MALTSVHDPLNKTAKPPVAHIIMETYELLSQAGVWIPLEDAVPILVRDQMNNVRRDLADKRNGVRICILKQQLVVRKQRTLSFPDVEQTLLFDEDPVSEKTTPTIHQEATPEQSERNGTQTSQRHF